MFLKNNKFTFFLIIVLPLFSTFSMADAGVWKSTGTSCKYRWPAECNAYYSTNPGDYCSNIGATGLLFSYPNPGSIVLTFFIIPTRKSGTLYECVKSCTSKDHKSCYNNDVYWYDSCNDRENKAKECGNSYCDTGGDVYKYCKNGDVWGLYDYRNRGCSGSSCYNSWNYNSCGDRLIESCGAGENCSGGSCVSTCTDECTAGICDGNKYRTCADHDGDGCLELDSGTNCKAFSCTSGEWTCQDWNTLEKDTSCNEAGCDVTKGGCYDDPDSTATITEDCQSGEICKNDQCVEDSSDGNWIEVAP